MDSIGVCIGPGGSRTYFCTRRHNPCPKPRLFEQSTLPTSVPSKGGPVGLIDFFVIRLAQDAGYCLSILLQGTYVCVLIIFYACKFCCYICAHALTFGVNCYYRSKRSFNFSPSHLLCPLLMFELFARSAGISGGYLVTDLPNFIRLWAILRLGVFTGRLYLRAVAFGQVDHILYNITTGRVDKAITFLFTTVTHCAVTVSKGLNSWLRAVNFSIPFTFGVAEKISNTCFIVLSTLL